MKTTFYLIFALFLSYQCGFAFTYEINSEELDSWYRAGCASYKQKKCLETLKYFYTLQRIEYGKHLKNKDEIIKYIDSKIKDCEGILNYAGKKMKVLLTKDIYLKEK